MITIHFFTKHKLLPGLRRININKFLQQFSMVNCFKGPNTGLMKRKQHLQIGPLLIHFN